MSEAQVASQQVAAANLRNVAIIAHVDHGKTTLVDRLLQETGRFSAGSGERVMDSNDLERERGITILAKNTSIEWKGVRINIVDTPGHADFGGEVERVLSMVDSVLLLVDAVDGPMPQTRFVTRKAFARGLRPIVVINKVDRDGARPDWVEHEVLDLFDRLDADEDQLDFTTVYASALMGRAGRTLETMQDDMGPLLDLIVEQVPPPVVEADGPLQMQISALDYSSYVGVIGLGRVQRGTIRPGMTVAVVDRDGKRRSGRILGVLGYDGLERKEISSANAGDIVSVTGIADLAISDTICDPSAPEPLPALTVDEPTVSMTFQVNTSPLAGREGKFLTSRHVRGRLDRELLHNVALRVEDTEHPDRFKVSGRGELHLSVLIETMRREGYELGVSRPEVITREVDGERQEPFETLVVDVEEQHQGAVIEELGRRRGELNNMVMDGRGRVRLDFVMPSRGLIGFRQLFLSLTSGSGILTHTFSHWGPFQSGSGSERINGVLVSNVAGKANAYALFTLQQRGRMMVEPGTEVYEGMVVGIHSRGNDLPVNPTKEKQLTNIRAAGSDENLLLHPPVRFSLEQALEFIDTDELVEVTPKAIRVRKKLLKEHERRRESRKDD
ncbi:MAG: translational GTPase TypA [Gammaproteobacteria bacterium]|nr:translational GTPase TypA [Gammaproteobacteria bacterium]